MDSSMSGSGPKQYVKNWSMVSGMSGTDPWLEVCQELTHGKRYVRN